MSKPHKPRIVVVGAGPAALSAGVHLLEEARGSVEVELVTMGHHLGGKAATWSDDEGHTIEHGFHAVFGFYTEMLALGRRAGVDIDKAFLSNRARSPFFDDRTGTLHELRYSRSGLVMLWRMANLPGTSEGERAALRRAAVRMAATVARQDNIEVFDDICYRAFLLEHGAPASFLRHPIYRQLQELLFNDPFEISTYIALKGAELLGKSFYTSRYFFARGGLSELFWEPIALYFERLGGRITRYRKLVGLEHTGGRLTGLRFAAPQNEGFHDFGEKPWPTSVPTASGTEVVDRSFAAVISTLPQACFVELNPGDSMWSLPYFANMHKLRSVPTLSMQIWSKEAVRAPVHGSMSGLARPLGYVIDNKHVHPRYARDPQIGSALQWVGTLAGFEHESDETIIARARKALASVPGYEGSDRYAPTKTVLRRNTSNYERYLLTEPGTLRFRPRARSPLAGLFLAGDWVRNEIDIPTMEGAIRCGKKAASLALDSLHR